MSVNDTFKSLPGLSYVKRAMEVAIVGNHSITIVDCNEMINDIVDAFMEIGGNDENIKIIKPCPCGNLTHYDRTCLCSSFEINRHRKSMKYTRGMRSDIIVESSTVNARDFDVSKNEKAKDVIDRIERAKQFNIINIDRDITKEGKRIFDLAYSRLGFNMEDRAKVINVARTIRCLDCEGNVEARHIAEAIQYRYRN